MLMKNIKPLAEPSWVSFCSVIENLDVCFSRPLMAYTEDFRSRTATVIFLFFLIACVFPHPCLLTLVCIFSLWTTMLHVIACLSKANYVLSIKIFVSVLGLGLTDVFLHVNPEVSVYVSTGRKIPKSNLKEACQTCL